MTDYDYHIPIYTEEKPDEQDDYPSYEDSIQLKHAEYTLDLSPRIDPETPSLFHFLENGGQGPENLWGYGCHCFHRDSDRPQSKMGKGSGFENPIRIHSFIFIYNYDITYEN